MNTDNLIHLVNRGSLINWNRLFYSVEVTNTEITIKERTLNIFQRALRSLFGLYSDTIWTQKKINHLFEQFPTKGGVINDLVTRLIDCNKRLNPATRPTQFFDIPREVQTIIFNKLDGASLGNCQQVCRSFSATITANELLWKNTFAAEHDGYLPPQKPPMGWRAFYVEQNIVRQNLAHAKVPKPVQIAWGQNSIGPLGGFTYCNNYYIIESNRMELASYSTTTGEVLKNHMVIPKTAFTAEPPLAAPLTNLDHRLQPLDSTRFLLLGTMQASIWDAAQNSCIFAVNNVKNHLVYANASCMIYYTTAGCLEIWDVATKKLLCRIEDLSLLPIHPTGQYKIIGSVFFTLMNDGVVHAYDVVKGEKLYTLDSGNERPFTRLLSTDTHLIALNENRTDIIPHPVANEDSAYVYAAASGQLLHTIELNRINNPFLRILPVEVANNQLVGIPRDTPGTVACWDLDTGAIVKRITPPAPDTIYSFNAACPGRLVITTTRPMPKNIGITIWDLQNESLLSQTYYQGCDNYFLDGTTVKIHNNIMYFGKWPNDKFHFWDVLEAKPIGTIPYESGYSHAGGWHFDGARFFINNNRGMQVYNLHQMQPKSLAAKATGALLSIFGK